MKVAEIIAILQGYDPNLNIQITWESTLNEIQRDNIYLSKWGNLLIDADENWYKKDYEKCEPVLMEKSYISREEAEKLWPKVKEENDKIL